MKSSVACRCRPELVVAAFVIVVTVLVIVFADPVAQDPAYHGFADRRAILGVPNFFNVVSNVPFLAVGWLGVRALHSDRRKIDTPVRGAWTCFFVGVFLVGMGSAYYHWAPDNVRLLWDRLPMGFSFMALVAVVVGEYVDRRVARIGLVPLLIVGCASVFYWFWSELQGIGDLRYYALVQFASLAAIAVIVAGRRSPFPREVEWLAALLLYGLAKVAEHFDGEIYHWSGVSGHGLKHLLASAAIFRLYVMLKERGSRGRVA